MKAKDEKEISEKLKQLNAYRASGQSSQAWAEGMGIKRSQLSGWLTYEKRWRARLEQAKGVDAAAPEPKHLKGPAVNGFAPVRLSGAAQFCQAQAGQPPSIRVQSLGDARMPWQLHWPISHAGELAAWLSKWQTGASS